MLKWACLRPSQEGFLRAAECNAQRLVVLHRYTTVLHLIYRGAELDRKRLHRRPDQTVYGCNRTRSGRSPADRSAERTMCAYSAAAPPPCPSNTPSRWTHGLPARTRTRCITKCRSSILSAPRRPLVSCAPAHANTRDSERGGGARCTLTASADRATSGRAWLKTYARAQRRRSAPSLPTAATQRPSSAGGAAGQRMLGLPTMARAAARLRSGATAAVSAVCRGGRALQRWSDAQAAHRRLRRHRRLHLCAVVAFSIDCRARAHPSQPLCFGVSLGLAGDIGEQLSRRRTVGRHCVPAALDRRLAATEKPASKCPRARSPRTNAHMR